MANFVEQALSDAEALRSSGPSGTDRDSYIQRALTGGFPLLVRSLDPTDRYERFTNYIDQSINYGMANLAAIRERDYLQLLLYRYAAPDRPTAQHPGRRQRCGTQARGRPRTTPDCSKTLFLIHRLPAWKATDSGPVSHPKIHMVDSGVAGRFAAADRGAGEKRGGRSPSSSTDTFWRPSFWARYARCCPG